METWEDWRIIEQVKDAATPEAMRAEIYRMERYDSLVRYVMQAANYSGMSSEDRYTILAYHALKAKNDAQSQLLQWVNMSAATPIIINRNTEPEQGK